MTLTFCRFGVAICCTVSFAAVAAAPSAPASPASQDVAEAPLRLQSTIPELGLVEPPANENLARASENTRAVPAAPAAPTVPTAPAPQVDPDSSIFFPPRLAAVDEAQKEKLRECAAQLKKNPEQHVLLTGYSDDLGSRSYNIAITEQRMAAVSKTLQSFGVEIGQIRRNRSPSVKVAMPGCRTEACRQQMRRVEFVCGEPSLP